MINHSRQQHRRRRIVRGIDRRRFILSQHVGIFSIWGSALGVTGSVLLCGTVIMALALLGLATRAVRQLE